MILTTNSYDVDAPEGARPPAVTQHITIRDWKVIGLAAIVFFVVSIPLFKEFKGQRDRQVCKTNLKGIYMAMQQYATMNGDRFPPLYAIGDNMAPQLVDGKPYVWASTIAGLMNQRDSFLCPSSEDGEAMRAIGHEGHEIELTYGMYLAMGTKPYQMLSQPNATALIVETSNNGALDSYDPLPFTDSAGNVVPFDAFMAGYDDSNFELTEKSKWITRLAIRNAKAGYGAKDVHARHLKGIHVIYADGHLGTMLAPSAEVENIYPDAEGMWRVR